MRISLGKRIRCLSVWLCCFVRSALIVVCCVYVAVNGFALTLKTMCEGWILRQICITSSEQHRYPFDEQHRSTDVWFFVFSVCMSLWVSVCQMLRARIWIICLHWISSFFSCSSIIIAPHTDADLTIIMAAIIIAIWTWISIINFLERALARVCVCVPYFNAAGYLYRVYGIIFTIHTSNQSASDSSLFFWFLVFVPIVVVRHPLNIGLV